MNAVKLPNEFNDIPDYNSPRVTVEFEYDQRDARHLTHTCWLLIDGEKICYRTWYEDDDFANCSEERPNTRDMWEAWINA